MANLSNYDNRRAKNLLVYYFRLMAEKAGVTLNSDCIAEIEEIVDDIIDAAVDEIKGGGKNEA